MNTGRKTSQIVINFLSLTKNLYTPNMKQILITALAIVFLPALSWGQQDQEKLDLPGDNLNLYAVLKIFQESETLEGFERTINDENTQVNNLDLDGDDNIDYIKVTDNIEDGVHYISMKVAVSETEDQDVGVFIVQKDRDAQVQIQLIGDEDLYGKDYIIEPASEEVAANAQTPNPGYRGQAPAVQQNAVYQVNTWPVIRFIFLPNYVIWRSPWRWHYYPSYWHPWRPKYWHYYYGYHYNLNRYYYRNYRRVQQYRYPDWRQRYYAGGMRSTSVIVINRTRSGSYRNTYSKPDLARDGYNLSRRNNPNISSRNRLPAFDNNGRPVRTRPATSRPAVERPVTRPGNGGAATDRPTTSRPTTGRPGNPQVQRPVTNPSPGNNGRPANRPTVTRPATSRPERPASRPNTQKAPSSRTEKSERGPR